jgi:hypothetical protein
MIKHKNTIEPRYPPTKRGSVSYAIPNITGKRRGERRRGRENEIGEWKRQRENIQNA